MTDYELNVNIIYEQFLSPITGRTHEERVMVEVAGGTRWGAVAIVVCNPELRVRRMELSG